MDALWDQNPNSRLMDLNRDQLEHLTSAAGEDPKTHARHVPIDVAMQAVVKAGGKMPTTEPAATQPASARVE
jgi:hypothetical protein